MPGPIAFAYLLLLVVPPAGPSRDSIQALFFTASWCEPCRAVEGVLRKLEHKYGRRLEVIPVDFDTAATESRRWEVREIPVVIVISRGKVLLRTEGASTRGLAALESAVTGILERRQKGGGK